MRGVCEHMSQYRYCVLKFSTLQGGNPAHHCIQRDNLDQVGADSTANMIAKFTTSLSLNSPFAPKRTLACQLIQSDTNFEEPFPRNLTQFVVSLHTPV